MGIKNLFRSKKNAAELPASLPCHVAIIMDGNGRWAAKRGLPRTAGHAAGSETFRRIATYCKDIGLEYLTVYAFSTENWKRPADEVTALFDLLRKYLRESIQKMERDRVKMRFMGDLSALPGDIKQLVQETQELSKRFEGVTVTICLNYGGRDEIVRAIKKLRDNPSLKADEAGFAACLDSYGIPDPDMLIRLGGEYRQSNFLLWQCAYSEMFFTDTLWPDFGPDELNKIFAEYAGRSRRYGGV